MDVVMLPLVSSGTPVETALARMRTHRRAGIVLERADDSHDLFYAGDVLRARATGTTLLDDVPNPKKVVLLDTERALKYQVDLVRPLRTQAQFQSMFGRLACDYSMVGGSNDTAMIVTASEEMTIALSLTGGYQCNGTPTHYFPEPRVQVGETCPEYPACTGPGGAVSIIELA